MSSYFIGGYGLENWSNQSNWRSDEHVKWQYSSMSRKIDLFLKFHLPHNFETIIKLDNLIKV